MATTLDELIDNPTLLDTVSVTEFGSVYKLMEEKPFANRTADEIALAGMLEGKKRDLINSSASRLNEMSKDDLMSLKALIGDAIQMSGVEVDLDALKGNIDKAIENINEYENSNQKVIDNVNKEPVNPDNWKNFILYSELSKDANVVATELNEVDNITLLRMLPHCKPEITSVGAGIQSEDIRALVYNEVNRRLGYAAENMDSLKKSDLKFISQMAEDEFVAKNASNMMKFASAYEEKMSELENIVEQEPVATNDEPVIEETNPTPALETEETLKDRRKQEFLEALAAYEASNYEDISLHEQASRLVELMSEEEINDLKADLEKDGNTDALTYLQGLRDEIVLEDEPEPVIETVEPAEEVEEPVIEEANPTPALETEETLKDRRKQEFLEALAAYEASNYEDESLHEQASRLVELMSEEEINDLKADLEKDGNTDALTYLQGLRDEIVLEDNETTNEGDSTDETDADNTAENDDKEQGFDKDAYFAELGKQNMAQLLVTVKAVKNLEDNQEQLKATEEFVASMARDINNNKQLLLNPQEWYQWRDLLNEFNDDKEKTNPEIQKALNKVNTDINSFEEEYGIDAASLQSPEQVEKNKEQIAKLSEIDFFYNIDTPTNKPWTDKEVEDWKKGAITPTLQGFSGALRNPNLSPEDKSKILEKAKQSLSQLNTVEKDPKAYGDLALVVSELKKAYPKDGAVQEADNYLTKFIENRGGTYLYPQMEAVSKKLDQLKVKGDLKLFGREDLPQNDSNSEIAKLKELTRIETETYLANITPAGTEITPQMFAQEYEARLNKAILSVVQNDCTVKGKNQAEIAKTLNDLETGKPVNIDQNSFIGYYVAKGAKGTAAADILGKNPGFKDIAQETKSKLEAFDNKCTLKYGEKYSVAKNILKSFSWGAAFGIAASLGPAAPIAMTAVATASFANQAHNIYKDFKRQRAIAVSQGKKFSFWKNYVPNNKLRIGGAFLSASTVAISGLGAVGVAVGPTIMSIKSFSGIGLALAGAKEAAANARAAAINHNKMHPNNKKSVFWAGLKAYGISALSFGAGMAGGQVAGAAVGNVIHAETTQIVSDTTPTVEQQAINTQTPTAEQTVVNNPTTVEQTTPLQTVENDSTGYTPVETFESQFGEDWTFKPDITNQAEEYRPSPLLPEDMLQDAQNTTETTVTQQPTGQTVQGTTEQTATPQPTGQTVQGATEQNETPFYKPFTSQYDKEFSLNPENNNQTEEYRPSPLLPEDMGYDAEGNLIQIPEGMKLDENGHLVNIVEVPEVSAKDIEFWNNRANQFLGEETTNNLYARIDSGEIKLPEGIESKQEFAYKLAMSMEQSPAYVADALGVEFQTTAQLESQIQSMTPEQFAKLSDLMNDYSDRGNYVGDNPFETTHTNAGNNSNASNNTPQNDSSSSTSPVNNDGQGQTVVTEPRNNDGQGQTIVTEPLSNTEPKEFVYPEKPVAPVIEQTPAGNNFEVVVTEDGRFTINGQSSNYQTFGDAARDLVGNNDIAVKDVSILMQQEAIIHDVEQQIANGATFNEQQLAYIEEYKQMHAEHLAEYADKYNIDANDIREGAINVKESYDNASVVTQPDNVIVGQTTDLTTVYETDLDGNPLDPKIQQQMLDTANEYATPLNALVENSQATHEHFEKQGLSIDYYKVGDETYHIQRDTGAHCDGSISIIHTDKDGVMTTLSLEANGTSTSYVDSPNADRIVVHKDANGNVINDNEGAANPVLTQEQEQQSVKVQAEPGVKPIVTGIDIVQPSVDDQWLPGTTMNDFVERLHNLSTEIRENNAMVDNSNAADAPKIQYEIYETDVLGNKLDPQIQQDIIDTANTYGRRLDAMVEHGYGTHEHFEHQGWSTDRYHIGNETFEISRDTGADADGRINITHIDANGVETFNRLEADGTSMTQINRPNEDSIVIHRDALGNVIDNNGQDNANQAPTQEGQGSATSPVQEQEGQNNSPRLNLKDEYLKDVKDLGLENPRSLSLHATEQRTSANGSVSGYSTYARFDRCDNGYSATSYDGASALVFDDKGNGVFKISENDVVRSMNFEEAQSFAKTISLIDGRADVVKLTEALYDNNHEAYALNEARISGLSGDITTLPVGDGMVAFSDNGVSITVDGRSYHAVLDETGKITESSSMMGTKIDGISSESMRESLQLVAEKNPESSIAKAFAALSSEQQGAENVQQQDVVLQPAQDGRPPVEGESLKEYRASNKINNYDGIATIADKNGNVVFSQEFDVAYVGQGSQLIPQAYTDGDGVVHVGPETYHNTSLYHSSESLVRHQLGVIIGEDKVYQELMAKENITPGEEAFMKGHEQNMDRWGLTHDENGNITRMYTSDMTRNNDGVIYNFDKDGLNIQKDGGLSEIKAEDKVYLDLKERQDNGAKLGLLEKQFMNTHEQELIDQHMYHNAKGNLVQLPEGVNVTRDGAAYRISSNIVAENSAYGLNQQDYLSDAKSLLDSTMRAKDQIAVKSFLMNDDIYADLKHRIDAGEQFSASENKAISSFMENHEAQEIVMSEKYGIVRGNDGEMHKQEPQTQTNSTPKKVMIGRNEGYGS